MFFIEENDNLVRYKKWFLLIDNNSGNFCKLCILMEKGEPLKIEQINKLDEKKKIYILIKISNCVKFLHDKDLFHLDLKLENIIKVGNNYKLIDFDSTLSIKDTLTANNKKSSRIYSNYEMNLYGTKELIKDNLKKHDIYSLGVLIWVIFFSKVNPWLSRVQKSTNFSFNRTYPQGELNKYKKNIVNDEKKFINKYGYIMNNNSNKSCISDLIMRCIGPIDYRPNISEIIEELERK